MPVALDLSQWIGVEGWGFPSSRNVSLTIFASFAFKNSATNYSSAADAATNFSIVQRVKIAPLRWMGVFILWCPSKEEMYGCSSTCL